MNDLDKKAAFEKALVAACSEFPTIDKKRTAKIYSKKTGQTHSYKYADLADIRSAITSSMGKHGLRWRQKIVDSQLLTIVAHVSGFEEVTESPLFPTMSDGPQALGSAITYSRRYGLQLALGIVTEEDDDGQAAEIKTASAQQKETDRGRVAEQNQKRPEREETKITATDQTGPCSEKQAKMIYAKAKAKNISDDKLKDLLIQVAGVRETSKVPWGVLDKVLNEIAAYKAH